MKQEKLEIVILGLSITSSWGNGHATTFRGLVKELDRSGHKVTFLERDVPWYASNRDLPDPPYCKTYLYSNVDDLKQRFHSIVRDAHLVVVGSYVPEGVAVGNWVHEIAEGILSEEYDKGTVLNATAVKGKIKINVQEES